jgi:hypothetical protein
MKNILDLEIDKLAADIIKGIGILLKALNFFSFRSSFFINPAFLGISNKNVKVL